MDGASNETPARRPGSAAIAPATLRWSDLAPAAILAVLTAALHLYTNLWAGYGFFRDELYYMVCSDNPALGYVDQPPLSILILTGLRAILGDSLFAIRVLPALLHALTVFMTGLLALEFGARRLAVVLAAVAAALSPIFLAAGTFYSMNAIEVVVWTVAAWIFVRMLKNPRPHHWLSLGLLLGLGLENKISSGWLLAGLFVGLLLTQHRRLLRSAWPWIAGGLAIILFAPFVIWNALNNWPHLEFMRNAAGLKYSSQTPLTFLTGQLIINNPTAVPLWLAGLLWLLFAKRAALFRPLAFVYLIPLLILIVNWHSKPEYLAAAYGILFAAGAVAIESWSLSRAWNWLKPVYLAILLGTGLMLTPMFLPILPVGSYIRYANALGMQPMTAEGKRLAQLPQFYADMFGWEEKAKAVASVYRALPDSDKVDCAVVAENYGRCAAMDIFGRSLGLPPAIGLHNNYWLWGPRGHTGKTVIVLGGNREDLATRFERVDLAAVVTCQYCMPYEDSLAILVCHTLKTPLAELWPHLKHYE